MNINPPVGSDVPVSVTDGGFAHGRLQAGAAAAPAPNQLEGEEENKKRTWKKPQGMPKRPLSAYNLFFRKQRRELLGAEDAKKFAITDQAKRKHRKTHGKIGFAEMARIIGQRWKSLEPDLRKVFEDEAQTHKDAYLVAMKEYKKNVKIEEERRKEQLANKPPSPRTDSAAVLATLGNLNPVQQAQQQSQHGSMPTHPLVMHQQHQQQQQNARTPGVAYFNPNGPGVDATRAALTATFANSSLFSPPPPPQQPAYPPTAPPAHHRMAAPMPPGYGMPAGPQAAATMGDHNASLIQQQIQQQQQLQQQHQQQQHHLLAMHHQQQREAQLRAMQHQQQQRRQS